MTRYWFPDGRAAHVLRGVLPEVGQLIASVGSRIAYRVLEIADRHQTNWHEGTAAAWEKAGCPDPEFWPEREQMALCEPARSPSPNGKDRRGVPLYPWSFQETWVPLQDPYPVCVDCGLVWPCFCVDRNQAAEKAMAAFDHLSAVLPGCCWACGEPIAGRQHSIEFDGENLLMPGAGAAVFHTAASRKAKYSATCRDAAVDYEARWVAADPARPIRLMCAGTLFRHRDRSECTTGDACPGVGANHHRHAYCSTGIYEWEGDAASGKPLPVLPPSSCGERGCKGSAMAGADESSRAA